MKKWLYFICSFLSPFSVTTLVTPTFDHAQSKNFWSAFTFCDHVSTSKKSVYIFQLFILQIQSILESHHQTGHTNFWHVHPRNFKLCFNLCDIVPHAKNQLIPSILSWNTVNFRVQRPDWPHSFLKMPHIKLFHQNVFPKNLKCTTFLVPCQYSEKPNDPIPRN